MKRLTLAIGLALLTVCYLSQFTVAVATRNSEPTRFTVRVENISSPEGMTASNGAKVPFALSPGMFVLSDKKATLFTEGKPARNGLEKLQDSGIGTGPLSPFDALVCARCRTGCARRPRASRRDIGGDWRWGGDDATDVSPGCRTQDRAGSVPNGHRPDEKHRPDRTLAAPRRRQPSAAGSASGITMVLTPLARILATVKPSRKASPVSIQFMRMMLSTSELMANSPIIDDMPSISGFSWL